MRQGRPWSVQNDQEEKIFLNQRKIFLVWVENFITRPPDTFHTNGIFVTVHRILYVTFIYIIIFSCLFRCYKSHSEILLNIVNTGTQVVLTWKYYKQINFFNIRDKLYTQYIKCLKRQYVQVPRYKPQGCWFNSRWGQWNFSMIYSFRPHYGPRVDPITEMSTRGSSSEVSVAGS